MSDFVPLTVEELMAERQRHSTEGFPARRGRPPAPVDPSIAPRPPAPRGRPPAPDSERRKMRSIRLTDEECLMVRELGYARYVEVIRRAYLAL